jgi:copper(I)-binding protein
MTIFRSRSIAALCVAATLTVSACGSDDDAGGDAPEADVAAASVQIGDPWSRQPVAGQTTGAVYATMTNPGDQPITLVTARTSVTDTAELHEVVANDDGTMTMRERDGGFEIPAGGSIVLEPGSLHIMLLDIDPDTYPDEIDVDLEFDDGTVASVTAPVRFVEMDMDGAMDGDMDGDMDGETQVDGGMDLDDPLATGGGMEADMDGDGAESNDG